MCAIIAKRSGPRCTNCRKLELENAELKAMNWVLKDSQLRTYDGLTEEVEALRAEVITLKASQRV